MPQPVPEDVADEDGQMHNDRMEVCFSRLWLCTPRPPMQHAGILISKFRVQAWVYGCFRLSPMLRCVTCESLCCFLGGGGGLVLLCSNSIPMPSHLYGIRSLMHHRKSALLSARRYAPSCGTCSWTTSWCGSARRRARHRRSGSRRPGSSRPSTSCSAGCAPRLCSMAAAPTCKMHCIGRQKVMRLYCVEHAFCCLCWCFAVPLPLQFCCQRVAHLS